MHKLLVMKNKFLKIFFLTKKQKSFIVHNHNILRKNNTNKLSQKIILMELNELVTNTIAFSYFAFYTSKNYNARIATFFPRMV